MKPRISHYLLIAILFLCTQIAYQRAVIGIDLGTEFLKIGLVKPGTPIDIVLNEQSKRKTESIVAFDGDERFIGMLANAKFERYPNKVFKYLNMLVGRQFSESKEIFQRFKNLYVPTNFVENKTRGTIEIMLPDMNTVFSIEELLAIILRYVKHLADEQAEFDVSECVITVPAYFNQAQRQAIFDAAKIAGVRVLGLIHETTALALQYGITNLRRLKETRHVVFYDLGAANLQVAVATYTPPKNDDTLGKLNIRGVAWEKTVGGIDFEGRLAKYFAELFKKKHGKDVSGIPKVMARFMTTAKKIKEVLSANKETIVQIDTVVDDIDFNYMITRKEFEDITRDLMIKALKPINDALEQAKIPLKEIHSFELVGGGSRVPALQQLLRDEMKRDLDYTLNSDEAIALGAAFQAAVLSPTFRTRSYEITDIFPHGVKFTISDSAEPDKQYQLFEPLEEMDSSKSVSLQRDKDFSITLAYDDKENPKISIPFIKFDFTGVEKALSELTQTENATDAKKYIKISFKLTPDGLITVQSANAVIEETIEVPDPENKEKTKTKQVTRQTPITVQSTAIGIPPMTSDMIERSIKKLDIIDEKERVRRLTAQKRNDLESHINLCRDQLLDAEAKPYATTSELEKLSEMLSQLSDWLDDEGDDTTADVYQEKYDQLAHISKPILNRMEEAEKRPREILRCRNTFNKTREVIKLFEQNYPQITQQEREELEHMVNQTEAWLDEKLKAQDKTPLNEPPVVTAEELNTACKKISTRAVILAKRPPPPPPPKPAENTTIPTNQTQETSKEAPKETSQEAPKETSNETPKEKQKEIPTRDEL